MRKIVSTNNILWGVPRIENTRISVYDIVSSLWHNREINEYVDDFEISEIEIKNALVYCKELICQKENVISFCDGCLLRTINSSDEKIEYKEVDENLFMDNENNFFITENLSEIENEEFGYAGWLRAEELYYYYFPDGSDMSPGR